MKLDPLSCQWLIWSHEHKAWWKPEAQGYTTWRQHAGRYPWDEALDIVRGANYGLSGEPNEAIVPDLPDFS